VRRGPLLTAVLAGVALLGAAPAQVAVASKTPKKTIRIGDNFFTPDAPKVKRGTIVTWKWPGFEEAGDVHDVKLKSGPKGVKKFHSEPASSDYSFKRKLKTPGKYKIVCTLHEDMRMTIRVKR
jgi:plastocyanin